MNILTAYFTYTGHSAGIAKNVSEQAGGELFEIRPATPYSSDYDTTERQAHKETDKGFQPKLAEDCASLGNADLVLVGTPNWFNTVASPVRTFLAENDFSGKRIAVFCTNGGGGLGHIEADVHSLCPNAEILTSLNLYEDGGKDMQNKIASWLEKIRRWR